MFAKELAILFACGTNIKIMNATPTESCGFTDTNTRDTGRESISSI